MTQNLTHKPESEILLDEIILTAAKDSRHETIARVKKACDDIEKSGKKIGAAAVARLVKERHGAVAGGNAQVLRNATEPLSRYISKRKAEQEQTSKDAGVSEKGDDYDLLILALRGNPGMQALAVQLRENSQRTSKSLERARVLLETLDPGVNMALLTQGDGRMALPSIARQPTKDLLSRLGIMVEIFSDEAKLAAFGLAKDKAGRIRRKNGLMDEFIPSGSVNGLTELLDMFSLPTRKG